MSPFGMGSKSGRRRRFGDFDEDTEARLRLMEAKSEKKDYEKLKEKVEKLTLVCEALWQFICEKHELAEDDLTLLIEKLKSDDEHTENCPQCGRVMNLNQRKCLYCGTQAEVNGFFDTL